MKVTGRDVSKFSCNLKLMKLQNSTEKKCTCTTFAVPVITMHKPPKTHARKSPWRSGSKICNTPQNSPFNSRQRSYKTIGRERGEKITNSCSCTASRPEDEYLCKLYFLTVPEYFITRYLFKIPVI